jgi:hypothetical protein
MSDLFPITLAEQIAEVRRELRMREAVYPREVARRGRFTQAQADRQINTMRAALETLERLVVPT